MLKECADEFQLCKTTGTFSNTFCCCDDFSTIYSFKKECALMGREIYDIVNDMAEVLNASQMQRLQEVLVKRLSENATSEHSQTTNVEFLDMFLTAKHLEGCSDKTIRYYRCNIEKMLDTINIPVIKITTKCYENILWSIKR